MEICKLKLGKFPRREKQKDKGKGVMKRILDDWPNAQLISVPEEEAEETVAINLSTKYHKTRNFRMERKIPKTEKVLPNS